MLPGLPFGRRSEPRVGNHVAVAERVDQNRNSVVDPEELIALTTAR
ncbi:hypothetical protein [Endozoicomonas sp. SCSIO W0465]|nr:hypothetical protein [Endozoicomonas sp. SCSIO W0465]USE36565.1 hypothetical protein MJO57_31920 [Endozoicomonas sp. SCSIO W0465]